MTGRSIFLWFWSLAALQVTAQPSVGISLLRHEREPDPEHEEKAKESAARHIDYIKRIRASLPSHGDSRQAAKFDASQPANAEDDGGPEESKSGGASDPSDSKAANGDDDIGDSSDSSASDKTSGANSEKQSESDDAISKDGESPESSSHEDTDAKKDVEAADEKANDEPSLIESTVSGDKPHHKSKHHSKRNKKTPPQSLLESEEQSKDVDDNEVEKGALDKGEHGDDFDRFSDLSGGLDSDAGHPKHKAKHAKHKKSSSAGVSTNSAKGVANLETLDDISGAGHLGHPKHKAKHSKHKKSGSAGATTRSVKAEAAGGTNANSVDFW